MTDMLISPAPARSRTHARPWVDELDGHLTCMSIVDVTHDVKSFSFALSGPTSLLFLPGQHLTFRLLINGERVERCYTISSPPTRPERLTITVKRVPDGVVSNWLHDHVRVGDAIGASGPYGQFSSANHPADDYLFLTAGSGITPAMSMLRTLCDSNDPANVGFVHCARTPDDIIFRDELESMAATYGVTVTILCESDSPSEQWRFHRGRLTLPALTHAAPDLPNREIFTCGPPPFMAAVRELLGAAGADPARCHEESFVLDEAVLGQAVAIVEPEVSGAGTTYTVDFRRSGVVVECDASTTILDTAARAGLGLPSSCGEGMCGACKLTMLGGQVDMRHAGGIRPREIAQDKILACCSTPLDDVAVDA